jgi:hypothetical protein
MSRTEQDIKTDLCKSLICPILLHGAPAWGYTAKSSMEQLQVIQNRIIWSNCHNLKWRGWEGISRAMAPHSISDNTKCRQALPSDPYLPVYMKLDLGLSPRANYTACRRSWCQRLRIEGAAWSAWRIPTAVFSDHQTTEAVYLPHREHNTSSFCSQELWHLDHRGGVLCST